MYTYIYIYIYREREIHVCIYIYIYIYIYTHTYIPYHVLRGETIMPIGNYWHSLSQQILAGIILVGRLGVRPSLRSRGTLMWA